MNNLVTEGFERTIGEASPEIVRDGMVELCVNRVEELLLLNGGH